MRPKPALSAFMMLAILLASSMGCIGLVPAREFMENLREPPKLEDRIENLVENKESSPKILNKDNKNDYTSILGLRKYIHTDTYRMIQSEPWTGTGLGTYEFIYPFYKKDSMDDY